MRNRTLIAGLLCAGALLGNTSAAGKKKTIEEELIGVPRPELAARVLDLIRHAPAHERTATAAAAIKTVSEKHPAAANSVVAAIEREDSKLLASSKGNGNGKGQGNGNGGNGNSGNGNGNGNSGNGNGNGNDDGNDDGPGQGNPGGGRGNGNGGVGHGPGPDKPGAPHHPKPINSILPNGKPRHFPPDPPRRPVNPPRPHQYNKPRNH